MADIRLPDVQDLYLQHKTLMRAGGQPHFSSLWVLNKELKVNASLVPLTLGVGMYGHLSLLLTLQQYATFSEEGFTSPTNPGPFTPPKRGTEAQIRAAREVWNKSQYTFHMCQAVERALITQVVVVVESPYLDAMQNTNTSRYGTVFLITTTSTDNILTRNSTTTKGQGN